MQREENEREERAKAQQKKDQERAVVRESAFLAGRKGDGAEMCRIVEENHLDVTQPQKLKTTRKESSKDKEEPRGNFETMLHIASAWCDVETVEFLLRKGKSTYPSS